MKANNEQLESVMIFGCGYVGTALARALTASGVRVGVLTRNPEKAAELRSIGLHEVIVADISDAAWRDQVAEDYHAVVNCVSSAGGGLDGYRRSYVEGQKRVLEWCRGRTIRHYVYTSSTSVYSQDNGATVDEMSETEGGTETPQILLEAERLLIERATDFECFGVLRLAGIYGPGRHYLLDQIREGVPVIPGSGDHHLNLIHRDDAVSAIRCILNGAQAQSGVYNLADDRPFLKAEVVGWLAEQCEKPVPQFDPNAVSARLVRRGGRMPDRIISNERMKEWFAWKPAYRDFREGYRSILASLV